MQLDDKWTEQFRTKLPVCQRYAYLNTGTAGPVPEHSAQAMQTDIAQELTEGRGNFATFDVIAARLQRCRGLAARVMGCDADEVALTHHTSDGINIVLWGIDWQPGDRIVTTTLEHDAAAVPLGLLSQRRGVSVEWVDVGLGERAVDALETALKAGAKLVILSHVLFGTGALLPIDRLVAMSHAAGAAVLVDGAQSCGAMPLDVHDLGVDFYTLSGQKWLCGPEGTGALYVNRQGCERLQPTFGSYFTAERHDFRGNVVLHQTARRFEVGMVHRPSWAGFEASVSWILDEVGLDPIWERSTQLAKRARAELEKIPGVTLVTPENETSQLLTFALDGWQPAEVTRFSHMLAQDKQIIIRTTMHEPRALRASFGFFNTEQDVARLVEAVATAG